MAPSRIAPTTRLALVISPLLRVLYASAAPTHAFHAQEPDEEPGSSSFWVKLSIAATLVLMGGVFAG